VDKWNKISNCKDISSLLNYYGGFHDSCIKELRYTSGMGVNDDKAMFMGESKDWQVNITFQRQWSPVAVELRFIGMRAMNIAGWQSNYFGDIFSCYLAMHNDLIAGRDEDLIVWADSAGFNPKDSHERGFLAEPMTSYIVAEELQWREVYT